MLDLYGGYCATANQAISTETITTAVGIATLSTRTEAAPGGVLPTDSGSTATRSLTGSALTATPTADGGEDDTVLSKSDIIALVTGLGVGIPSLAVAVIALVLQVRKRRSVAASQLPSAAPSASSSQTALAASAQYSRIDGYGQPSQAYELDNGHQWRR